ncbi:MAG: TIGR04255 family protein, partial [Pseudomonadota bacterium]|nr:TIGR04255 family protein [Pseudomonadota bacterium]
MFEDVCYRNPFLKEVIFKADFPTLVLGVEKGLSAKASKTILNRFPLSEPQKAHAQEFQFSGGSNFQTRTQELMQWIFHGEKRDKTLAIDQHSFSYTNRAYKT